MQLGNPIAREALVAGLLSVLITVSVASCALACKASVRPQMLHLEGVHKILLGHDAQAHGYKGAPGAISIKVDEYSFSMHVEGADAYDAAAVVLTGVYDDAIHKWVGIGGAHSTKAKDWHSITHWESYHFEKISDYFNVSRESMSDYYRFVAEAKVTFKVVHKTWWLRKNWWRDPYNLQVIYIIPKNEFG